MVWNEETWTDLILVGDAGDLYGHTPDDGSRVPL
jgi:hypothetical protein